MVSGRYFLAGALLICALAACQPQKLDDSGESYKSELQLPWPRFDFAGTSLENERVFVLDPAKTRIDIIVRRSGPLAHLGHDHVICVQNTEGYLLLSGNLENTRAELRFKAEDLDVDPTGARMRYQLDTQPDAGDIEATRRNLLNKVLESQKWPYIALTVTDFLHENSHYSAQVEVRLKGISNRSRESFKLSNTDSGPVAEGSFVIRQSDFGIEPLSALGGGLKVADELTIHFRINGLPYK